MIIEEDACIEKVNQWITNTKKNAYEKNINSESSDTTENPKELFAYQADLEKLEDELSKAIQKEDMKALSTLHWPDELMDCIKDMAIRVEILDLLKQAFTINHFNKSPKHEAELQKDMQW
jgi:hypothetical protein